MVKHLPNFLTLCNLICGVLGIIFAFNDQMYLQADKKIFISANDQLYIAAFLLLTAAIFDFFDGFVARMVGHNSSIGKDLDSLADMVSFGVLPALLAYRLLSQTYYADSLSFETSVFAAIPALLLAVFAALRLAIFNNDSTQAMIFRGLPTPAMGIFWAGLVLALQYNSSWRAIILNKYLLIIAIALCCYLMISHWRMLSLKLRKFAFVDNKWVYLIVILSLLSLMFFKFASLPIIIVLYIVVSIISNYAQYEIPS